MDILTVYPHCDARILHAPGECEYCDKYPKWQKLREGWGIAFTGHEPTSEEHRKQLPCPADYNRPPESEADHRHWGGNRAAPPGEKPVGRDGMGYAVYEADLSLPASSVKWPVGSDIRPGDEHVPRGGGSRRRMRDWFRRKV